MATPTGGYRRTITVINTDVPYNTNVDAYTCPANTKAVVELRSGVATVNGPSFYTTNLDVIIRQTDGNGNIFNQEVATTDITSNTATTTPLFSEFDSPHEGSDKPYRYHLGPGDILRFFNTVGSSPGKNGAVPIRIKYIVYEESNSDI
jgi:hypothetical protein